ncbi:MAG: sulfotransferase domain-containing protein [Acidobacteria bacterium]|nr:sulfotransferase domain-containing protein [Acidobacteriota bacterium]
MQQGAQIIEGTAQRADIYSTVQQEVEFGTNALKRKDPETAITFFQSALEKLSVEQPFYDHLVHNLLLSYKLLIEQRLKSGDTATSLDFLRAALRLEIKGEMAEDSGFLQKFAGEYQGLSVIFLQSGWAEQSLVCCRKAISIFPGAGSYVNLTNALTAAGRPAELGDLAPDLRPEDLGRHIFIACAPKSGSTFLKNLLVDLTGYRDAFMVYSPGQFEQEIYLPTLRDTACIDTVTQQHCRASDANIHLMQAFRIRPVVLVRNILDSVASLVDFYDQGAFRHSYFRGEWPELGPEAKTDLLIDNLAPWFLQFVASWSLAEKDDRLDVHWLTYEDLIADKPGCVLRVLEFYGLGAARRGLEQRIVEIESQGRKNRFNKGVAGRGKRCLSEKQQERIRALARHYPTTDFSRIGL